MATFFNLLYTAFKRAPPHCKTKQKITQPLRYLNTPAIFFYKKGNHFYINLIISYTIIHYITLFLKYLT